jgi:hypothetical protein
MGTAEKELRAEYYSEGEVEELLGWHHKTLLNRIREGRNHPPVRTIGKRRWYPKKPFWEWVNAQELKKQVS